MKTKLLLKTTLFILLAAITFSFTSCEKDETVSKNNVNNKETRVKATAANGTFIIYNRNSNLAMDHKTSDNTVIQYSYWGGSNQKWVLCDVGGGYYRISPVDNPYLALDINGASTSSGASAITWTYWGGANELFQFVSLGNGYYKIVNKNSGLVLAVRSSSTANNAVIEQTSYTGANSQQWSLTASSSSYGNGKVSWTLTTSGVPSNVQTLITDAMNKAVARYNFWGSWSARTLTVEYNTGVATADGNINGNIRFGANTSYMTECTAMHEIAHTYGVGTSSAWAAPLIQNYLFVGTNAVAKIHEFDGSSAVINTGGGHFWPYGLNYNSEWSNSAGERHAQIVWAMKLDGLY